MFVCFWQTELIQKLDANWFGFPTLFHELSLHNEYKLWPSWINMMVYPATVLGIPGRCFEQMRKRPQIMLLLTQTFMNSFKLNVLVGNLLLL